MADPHRLPGRDVVVDGLRLYLVSHGQAERRPPVLLLHGLPTSSYLWRDVMRDLAPGLAALAPDLVGLGRSERPARGGYGLAAQAALLAGLLDQLTVDRVVLAGHDLGGAVAVHLAALAPERVAGLVLVDSPIHPRTWPTRPVLPLLVPLAGEAYLAGLRRLPGLAAAVLRRALSGVDGAAPPPPEVDRYLQPLLSPEGARGLLRFVRAVDLTATEAAWRVVTAAPPPALVLWGAADHLHPTSYGQELAAELGEAGWVPVEGAGHLLPAQRPERVAEEIAGFAAELTG